MGNKSDIEVIVGSILGLLLLCAGILALSYRSEHTTYIHDMTWERHIIVEEYRTVIEENTHLPSKARELDRWTESEEYECGMDEDGDVKYCTRWDTHYRYEIDKWVYAYTLLSKGSDREPYWPTVTQVRYTTRGLALGDQRLGAYSEYYHLHFIFDGKPLVYTTHDMNEWLSFEIEYRVVITRNILGSVIAVRKDV